MKIFSFIGLRPNQFLVGLIFGSTEIAANSNTRFIPTASIWTAALSDYVYRHSRLVASDVVSSGRRGILTHIRPVRKEWEDMTCFVCIKCVIEHCIFEAMTFIHCE
jgi:hypothetical protein